MKLTFLHKITERTGGIVLVFSKRISTEKIQSQLSIAEVYNLWDLLSGHYDIIENLRIFRNYVHDADLVISINNTIDDAEKRARKILEKMKYFGVASPDSPRKNVPNFVNKEIIHDGQIGLYLLFIKQERLEMKLRAIRQAIFNDEIREFFISFIKNDIDSMDNIVKYLKLKGWLRQKPLYPNVPKESTETIDTGEAYSLWEHLVFRYDNIEQTNIYANFAHDGEFKLLLSQGIKILQKQVETLEKEMEHFGLIFPKKPPEYMGKFQSTENLNDDYMFRIMLAGMEGAIVVHVQALKIATTNDRIRKLFAGLLLAEIKLIDKIIKYGKAKGWIYPPPIYRI